MRTLPIIMLAALVSVLAMSLQADELSLEQQQEIIIRYMQATGQSVSEQVLEDADLEEHHHHWCSMPVVTAFIDNYKSFDSELMKSLSPQLAVRPGGLAEVFVSPSGNFAIHYSLVGIDEVYQSGVDNNGNQVPDYVEDVAQVLDHVHNYEVNTLGYPEPISDGFYSGGGDARFDVYLMAMPSAYYGQTYPDSIFWHHAGSDSVIAATSYMKLRNDYSGVPGYQGRPLDAMKVTVAHEYFHSIQFGIDYAEAAGADFSRRFWMEMSAVWMEEEVYDDINDYYYYLPYFFDYPERSIQQFSSVSDQHPYASVVYPLFLAEKYDRDLIRDIWLRCGELGSGPSFLRAAQLAIDSVSGGLENWATIFSEFALWNYFTGDRAHLAPNDMGYSEKENYPGFSDDAIHSWRDYPVVLTADVNDYLPDHNAAYYLTFEELWTLRDTSFWVCNDGSFPDCTDSTWVIDTANQPYDIMHIDSFFTFWVLNGDNSDSENPTLPDGWGVNVVYQLESNPDSVQIDAFLLPDDAINRLDLIWPSQYRTVTFILTPASEFTVFYDQINYRSQVLGYHVPEIGEIDSSLINRPAAFLAPYPNPAVLNRMSEPLVKFMFQMPTDETSFPIFDLAFNDNGFLADADPLLLVNIYSLAGERVRTLDHISWRDDRKGVFQTEWDLTNDAGGNVASGVYLVSARLFSKSVNGVLLTEARTKVAVIR